MSDPDLSTDARRLARALSAGAPFVPQGAARDTLTEAARLLTRVADGEDRAGGAGAELARLRRELAGLEHALGEERRWLPDGLYLLESGDGALSRRWVPRAGADTLDALLPRAALLRHHAAVTRALVRHIDTVRAGVTRGPDGVPERLTWPAAATLADTLLEEIARDLDAPQEPS